MRELLQQLAARLGQVDDLQRASAVLEWDQQTYMPPGGAQARAEQMATLEEMAHSIFVSDETGRLLEELRPRLAEWPYDGQEASMVRVASREYQKLRKLPPALVAERARTAALAFEAWQSARADSDYGQFLPHMERVIDLCIRIAEALGYEDRIYDALLDQFEPGMRTAEVASIFEEMKLGLVPLVSAISERADYVDDAILRAEFDPDQQWALGEEVLGRIGFSFDHGRQDRSTHPFTTSFSSHDVRLTTRIDPHNPVSGLYATIHEGGHALYEQGLPLALARTPLCDGASLGVHESQSRMWENVIGRSREFCGFLLPLLQQRFPGALCDATVEQLYRAINRVQPGFIRVDADEVTYSLHIFLRFELENDLLEGRLLAADLPDAWNAKMETYLGLTPPSDSLGVLQDVHWSDAILGYFPTYALGNLLSVQFYSEAVTKVGEIPKQIARGEFSSLLAWLREHIHQHGSKFTPAELVARVTGGPIDPQPYLDYVWKKYGEIYAL
jgi:carboxypeptidase Taq